MHEKAGREGKLQEIGNTGSRNHETSRDKRKIRKEYLRKTRILRETKLCNRNLIKGMKLWREPHAARNLGRNLK